MLNESQVREFQEIYKKVKGIGIEEKEAYEQGIKLRTLFKNSYDNFCLVKEEVN